jgi:hypothetical protein
MLNMSKRQKRTDGGTAKAVVRAVNILAVRDRAVAQNYLEYKQVPPEVIARVLDDPASRRAPSTEEQVSEAITPSAGLQETDE